MPPPAMNPSTVVMLFALLAFAALVLYLLRDFAGPLAIAAVVFLLLLLLLRR